MNKKDLIRLRNQLARDFKQLEKCSDKTIKVITKNGTVKNIPSVQLRDYYPKDGIRKLASKPKRIFDTVFTYSNRAKLKVKKDEPMLYVVEPSKGYSEVVKVWLKKEPVPNGNSVIYDMGEHVREPGIPILKRWKHLSDEWLLEHISIKSNSEVEPREFTYEWVSKDSNEPLTNMRKVVPESERITLMPDGTHKRELLDTATGLPIHPKDESNAIERLYQGWLDRIGDKVSLKEFVDGLPHEERIILRNALKENYGDLESLLIDSVFADNIPEGATNGNLSLSIDFNED